MWSRLGSACDSWCVWSAAGCSGYRSAAGWILENRDHAITHTRGDVRNCHRDSGESTMSISVVGYFSDHSGRTVGEKWQTCRDADQLNLLRSICARRPTGQRQTLCTLDIFQTSSAACLLLNYRLYTRGRCVQCPATDATLTEEVVCVCHVELGWVAVSSQYRWHLMVNHRLNSHESFTPSATAAIG